MRRLLLFLVALSLFGSPALAQGLHQEPLVSARPLQDWARVEVARMAAAQAAQPANDDYRPGGMHPGYFWTGIGLMSAGGVYMVSGALLSSDDGCDFVTSIDPDADCGGIGTAVFVLGAALAGSGALVYMIGKKKARALGNPTILPMQRGIAFRGQFVF